MRSRLTAALGVIVLLALTGCATPVSIQARISTPAEVTGISATSGSLIGGETVSIEGVGLGSVDKVMFGTELAAITIINPTQVDVVVPHSYTYTAGAVPVTISTHQRTLPTSFSYDYQVLTPTDRELEYAFEHWDDYNLTQYGNFTDWGGDCQNFVSQSLVARGWATTEDWYNDAQVDWASAFVYVPDFDAWLASHPELGASRVGDRSQLKIGDIVLFDWDNDGSLDHAEIVSGTAMVDGQLHIYLVGHDIDTRYRDLDDAIADEGQTGAAVYFWSLS